MPRATLATIAAAAGVSAPTVSKVLNGRPDVSAATRARIEHALREHGYVPQVRSPGRRLARTIDLVFDELLNPYTSEVMRGVTIAANAEGVDVVVGLFPDRSPRTMADAWAKRLVAAGREGIIVATSVLTRAQIAGFDRARIPLVVVDPLNLPRVDVASVGATNWAGGVAATDHLIDLGHRRIGFVGGLIDSACEQARLHGYLASLTRAGIEPDPALVSHRDFHYETGYGDGARLLDLAEPPTAVFAASDAIALGVLETAREHGLTVPGDLSVVGFDDTYVAEWTTPPLTTVRQPLQEMGALAFRTLMRLRAGDPPESHHVEMATQLILRGSTAPPREVRPAV